MLDVRRDLDGYFEYAREQSWCATAAAAMTR
jgi:hypothetical protein